MTPRPYDRTKRKAASDAVRQRIVRAIVKLHAKYGIRATTHAMIAKTADVSIPTVYNHFRTRSEVVLACGSHLATLVRPAGEDLLE
ncbi:MAG TPA: helix-turn-helix domain-containing protein, partial [Planctomycetota bacterium]|nr:helix-turn-helix domain-containing protein [Planctomycetota bacterium]